MASSLILNGKNLAPAVAMNIEKVLQDLLRRQQLINLLAGGHLGFHAVFEELSTDPK